MSYKISTQQVNFKDIGQEEYNTVGILQSDWQTIEDTIQTKTQTAAEALQAQCEENLSTMITGFQNTATNIQSEINTYQTNVKALKDSIDEKNTDIQEINAELDNVDTKLKDIPYLNPVLSLYEKSFYYITSSTDEQHPSKIQKKALLSITQEGQKPAQYNLNTTSLISNIGRPASVKLTFTNLTNEEKIISRNQIKGSSSADNTKNAIFYLYQNITLPANNPSEGESNENNENSQVTAIALCSAIGSEGNGFDTFSVIDSENNVITDIAVSIEQPSANGVYSENMDQYYDITAIWTEGQALATDYYQYRLVPVKKGDVILFKNNSPYQLRLHFLKDSNFLNKANNTIISDSLIDISTNNNIIWNFSSPGVSAINQLLKCMVDVKSMESTCFIVNNEDMRYFAYQTLLPSIRQWINSDLGLFYSEPSVDCIINNINLSLANNEKYNQTEKFFNQYLQILQPQWRIHYTYYNGTKFVSTPIEKNNHFISSLIITEGLQFTIYDKKSIPNLKIRIYQAEKANDAVSRYLGTTPIEPETLSTNFGIKGVNQYYYLELYLEDSTAASPFNSSEDINQAIMIIPSSDQGLVLNNELLQTFITETHNDYSALSTDISNYIAQTRYQLKQDILYPLPQSVSDWPYASSTKKNKIYSQEFSTGDYYCRVILNLNKYQYQIHPTNNGDIININAPLYQTSIPTILPPSYTFKVAIEAKVEAGETPPDLHEEEIFKNVLQNFYIIQLQKTPIQWCALGDSITEGYTSRKEQSTTNGNLAKRYTWNWAEKFASQKQWFLDNQGVGGTGWIDSTSGDAQQGIPKENALTIVQNLLKDEYFKNIDIVTLAWGINDYKGSGGCNLTNATPLGDINNMATIASDWYNNEDISQIKTIVDSMYAIISAILLQNPSIQLYVLLPINCAIGSQYSDADGGDSTFTMQDNYCMNKLNNEGYSLYQLRNTMIQMCEFLGVEYIDTTLQGPINRFNLNTYLLDGVHPSEDGHKLLARYYDSKIHFSKDII